jgi:hypothetical protein
VTDECDLLEALVLQNREDVLDVGREVGLAIEEMRAVTETREGGSVHGVSRGPEPRRDTLPGPAAVPSAM